MLYPVYKQRHANLIMYTAVQRQTAVTAYLKVSSYCCLPLQGSTMERDTYIPLNMIKILHDFDDVCKVETDLWYTYTMSAKSL